MYTHRTHPAKNPHFACGMCGAFNDCPMLTSGKWSEARREHQQQCGRPAPRFLCLRCIHHLAGAVRMKDLMLVPGNLDAFWAYSQGSTRPELDVYPRMPTSSRKIRCSSRGCSRWPSLMKVGGDLPRSYEDGAGLLCTHHLGVVKGRSITIEDLSDHRHNAVLFWAYTQALADNHLERACKTDHH